MEVTDGVTMESMFVSGFNQIYPIHNKVINRTYCRLLALTREHHTWCEIAVKSSLMRAWSGTDEKPTSVPP